MSGDTAVLDLLFDQCDGVLKEEVPAIQTLDFVSGGYRIRECTGDITCHSWCIHDCLTSDSKLF